MEATTEGTWVEIPLLPHFLVFKCKMEKNLSAGDRRLHSLESNSFVSPCTSSCGATSLVVEQADSQDLSKSVEAWSSAALIKTADYCPLLFIAFWANTKNLNHFGHLSNKKTHRCAGFSITSVSFCFFFLVLFNSRFVCWQKITWMYHFWFWWWQIWTICKYFTD